MSRKSRRGGTRKKSHLQLAYKPLESLDELQALESKVGDARRGFVAHLTTYGAVNGFLMLVNAVTSSPRDDHVWFLYPALGWAMGLAPHAASALIALPRALRVQRKLLAQRGLVAPEAPAAAEVEGPAIHEELASVGARIRERLRELPSPRLDLEAALAVAERQASRISEALGALQRHAASAAAARADRDRQQALASERERLSASLESYRVTLANLEVDALLLSNTLETHGSALEMLQTESEMLHAAAEGAQKAMEAFQSGGTARGFERA